MKAINLILISLFFFSSCSTQVERKNERNDSHRFVKNTNVFIIPIQSGIYKRTTSYKGFEELSKIWKIKVMDSKKNMEQLNKTYDKENLKKQVEAELVEKFKVIDQNGNKGFYVNYVESKKNEKIHMLIVEHDSTIVRVKGTVKENAPEELDDLMKASILDTYIGNKKEVEIEQKRAETIPNKELNIYSLPENDFIFAGELNSFYYFTKDGEYPTLSPDSSWIAFKPIWNASLNSWQKMAFTEILGENYELIQTENRGKNNIVWLGKNQEYSKTAFAGFIWGNNINLVKGAFDDSFEENSKLFINTAFKTRMR